MALPPITFPEGCDRKTLHVMHELSVLVRDCTAEDPAARPSFREV